MLISRLKLKNWRNFREVDVPLGPRGYLIGANASGKSNLLDVFRFLRTLAQAEGGGLQKALKERGGLSRLRSLHARKDPEVRIAIELSESHEHDAPEWIYTLAFKSEGKGQQRAIITEESVLLGGQTLLKRPSEDDRTDPVRLTQTHLEQINNNAKFRDLADHFSATTCLHLVPQLLKHAEEISGRLIENDPFGQGLLQRIAKASPKARDARLKRIQQALSAAVPQFAELRFAQDSATGTPHLEANFQHWRASGAWQREEQFSDGTLRLIGLLWALQEGDGLLLLEEPELSLNDAIVEHLPLMIDRVLRQRKRGPYARQVLLSTHSEKLIASIADARSILLLEPGTNGTSVRLATEEETERMEGGLTPAEVLLPITRPQQVEQMGLFG